MPVPLGTLLHTAEALRKESERKRDELELGLMTDIAQLKAGFGEPRFQKFEDYLHKLYANAGVETECRRREGEEGGSTSATGEEMRDGRSLCGFFLCR